MSSQATLISDSTQVLGQSASKPLPEQLSWKIRLLYGAPNFAGAAMIIPIFVLMPKFYADVVLVPLGYLAIAIAAARSLDALSDPFLGWISDRTRTRWGRRRPYIVVGAPLCALAFFALLNPPWGLSGAIAALWFGTTFILYFLFSTIYGLSHYALGPELTLDYHERSTLFAVRESFTILGTIAASAAPGFMMKAGIPERRVFFLLGIAFGVLLIALYWMLAFGVRERRDFVERKSNPLVPGIRRALKNRPFAILLASYVVGSVTGAIPATMLPFFNAYVIRPPNPELWLSIELLCYFGFGFLSLPLWLAGARRFGKLPAWLASFIAGITGGGAMFFLGKGDVYPLLALISWAGCGFGAGLFLTPAMQADVIDYDEFHTGKRREAQYGAFWAILPKFVAIPSAAIPIAILASLGYVPNAVQSPQVILAIKGIFALGPAIFATLSFIIARTYPIDERSHRAILEGIALHNEGAAAIDPLANRIVSPPHSNGIDEETGWFLDYFSQGELKRYLAHGAASPVRDVWRAAALSLGVCGLSAWYVLRRLSSLRNDPGAMVSLCVVAAGFAFTIFLFHMMRLRPARALATGRISPDIIRTHLNDG